MIKNLEHDDIIPTLDLVKQAFDESIASSYGVFREDEIYKLLLQSIQEDTVFCQILVLNDEVKGLLYGILVDNPIFGVRDAMEILLYVTPEIRGFRFGVKLVSNFVEWAKENKAKTITVESSFLKNNEDRDKVTKMYELMGFTIVGTMLKREVT